MIAPGGGRQKSVCELPLSVGSLVANGTGHPPGYTVLELLVSLLIITLLLAGLYTVLFQTQTSFESQQNAMALRQEGRVVLNGLAIELRMAGFDLGSFPETITEARSAQLGFVADIDGGSGEPPCDIVAETAAGGGAERITYVLRGTDLLRSVDCWNGSAWTRDSANQRVARNVASNKPLFRYFDDADNELLPGAAGLTATQRAAVHSIGVDIELEDPTVIPGKPMATFTARTRVTLRNVD